MSCETIEQAILELCMHNDLVHDNKEGCHRGYLTSREVTKKAQ